MMHQGSLRRDWVASLGRVTDSESTEMCLHYAVLKAQLPFQLMDGLPTVTSNRHITYVFHGRCPWRMAQPGSMACESIAWCSEGPTLELSNISTQAYIFTQHAIKASYPLLVVGNGSTGGAHSCSMRSAITCMRHREFSI